LYNSIEKWVASHLGTVSVICMLAGVLNSAHTTILYFKTGAPVHALFFWLMLIGCGLYIHLRGGKQTAAERSTQ